MDRERLQRWLQRPDRTWRWRQGAEDGYRAVETTEQGLRWYRWSHEPEEGGESDVLIQSYADFHARGPARELPEEVSEELGAWVRAHQPRS